MGTPVEEGSRVRVTARIPAGLRRRFRHHLADLDEQMSPVIARLIEHELEAAARPRKREGKG